MATDTELSTRESTMPSVRTLLNAALLAMCTTALSTAWAVEVNTATEAELDSVKGLGPSQTARILQAREQGLFKDWADLMRRVKGIRPATASKLSASGLTVSDQPYQGNAK